MARGIKATFAAVALGMGLVGSGLTVKADTYSFRISPDFLGGGFISAMGSFTADGAIGSSTKLYGFSGTFSKGFASYNINSGSGYIPTNSSGQIDISLYGSSQFGYGKFNFSGYANYVNNTYVGSGGDGISFYDDAGHSSSSDGFGQIVASLVAPTSSSPSSGSAPSPEANTLLGFLVVAGTVAIIKRKRHDEAEGEAA